MIIAARRGNKLPAGNYREVGADGNKNCRRLSKSPPRKWCINKVQLKKYASPLLGVTILSWNENYNVR